MNVMLRGGESISRLMFGMLFEVGKYTGVTHVSCVTSTPANARVALDNSPSDQFVAHCVMRHS